MGFLGDDERREKDQQAREAAYSRWEDRGERVARRSAETGVDIADMAVSGLIRVAKLPFRAGSALWAGLSSGVSNASTGSSGKSWKRRDD